MSVKITTAAQILLDLEGGFPFRYALPAEFPWHEETDLVWYALYLTGPAGIIKDYAFRAKDKEKLVIVLEAFVEHELGEIRGFRLEGQWTGKATTHRFVLDPQEALEKLRAALRTSEKAEAAK